MNLNICKKIPYELVTHHIIPYTYEVIPDDLNIDICSYVRGYHQLIQLHNLFLSMIYEPGWEPYLHFNISLCERLIYDIAYYFRNDSVCVESFQIGRLMQRYESNLLYRENFKIMRRLWAILSPENRDIYLNKWKYIENSPRMLWPFTMI
tara:strand:+ start:684 stop:1133 length:450 start_codon:yes stop_codon:yes gene_type:complete